MLTAALENFQVDVLKAKCLA